MKDSGFYAVDHVPVNTPSTEKALTLSPHDMGTVLFKLREWWRALLDADNPAIDVTLELFKTVDKIFRERGVTETADGRTEEVHPAEAPAKRAARKASRKAAGRKKSGSVRRALGVKGGRKG